MATLVEFKESDSGSTIYIDPEHVAMVKLQPNDGNKTIIRLKDGHEIHADCPYTEALRQIRAPKLFETYREEDKHECGLLWPRINAFATWQTLLILTGAAILNIPLGNNAPISKEYQWIFLIFIAVLGWITAMFAAIAISGGCRVLAKWHWQGRELIKKNEKNLEGLFLRKRDMQPDFIHVISMDAFGLSLPLLVGLLWVCVIGWLNRRVDILTNLDFPDWLIRNVGLISVLLLIGYVVFWVLIIAWLYRSNKKDQKEYRA